MAITDEEDYLEENCCKHCCHKKVCYGRKNDMRCKCLYAKQKLQRNEERKNRNGHH